MKEIRVEETQKLSDILETIKAESETQIEITNSQAPVFQIGLNKAVLIAAADSFGKKVTFKEAGAAPTPNAVGAAAVGVAAVVAGANHGFVEGQDVAQVPPVDTPAQGPEHALEVPKKKKSFLSFFKLKGPKWLYLVGVLVLFFVVGGFLLVTFLPSATVELQTTQQLKETQVTVVASATATSVDEKTSTVPLKQLETTAEDSIEQPATGSKETGTPAKGKVTIINHDVTDGSHDGAKTFVAGTTVSMISGSALFTLDETVSVDASPAACTTNCAQASVDVTSKSIGEAGNVPAETTFKVGDASVSIVSAKALTNFSGGTSKKIKVVSAEDHKKAQDDLLTKMSEEATKQLEDKNPDMIIPEGSIENQILQKTYTKQVNEEAENFKLTMQVKFVASAVEEDDMQEILGKAVLSEASGDFKLEDENTTISAEVLEKTGADLKLLGKIKTALSPNIDENEVKAKLAGKKFSQVEEYLKGLDSVSGFEIRIEPTLFTFLQTFPSVKDKIEVKISQENQ